MPNYITPTLNIQANANSVTTGNKGPLSVALSLTASKLTSVDKVNSEIITVPYTDAATAATLILDHTAYVGTGVGGTDGGYVYLSNITASGVEKIFIGVHAPGLQTLHANDEDHRFCTLMPGEFAFFPYDYTLDISVDATAANQTLEYWVFDRG